MDFLNAYTQKASIAFAGLGNRKTHFEFIGVGAC